MGEQYNWKTKTKQKTRPHSNKLHFFTKLAHLFQALQKANPGDRTVKLRFCQSLFGEKDLKTDMCRTMTQTSNKIKVASQDTFPSVLSFNTGFYQQKDIKGMLIVSL